MDGPNKSLFNILRIVGPVVFFAVVFAVLYFFTDLSVLISLLIALGIAVADYFMLTLLMGRIAGPEE